jgi:hypothetical protein
MMNWPYTEHDYDPKFSSDRNSVPSAAEVVKT